jgi:phage-related protein
MRRNTSGPSVKLQGWNSDVWLRCFGPEGRLVAPYGEKVSGYTNLFAIRVTRGQNVRFFYAYDDGIRIYILHGYEKKSRTIPERESRKAIAIKKELGL